MSTRTDLSPRSPFGGAHTASIVPSAEDPLDVLARSAERRRREAKLGRADAGASGDVDASDAPVGESDPCNAFAAPLEERARRAAPRRISEAALRARTAQAERLLATAEEVVASSPEDVGGDALLAMARREAAAADAALVAAGLHESAQDEPTPERNRPGAMADFLREGGDVVRAPVDPRESLDAAMRLREKAVDLIEAAAEHSVPLPDSIVRVLRESTDRGVRLAEAVVVAREDAAAPLSERRSDLWDVNNEERSAIG